MAKKTAKKRIRCDQCQMLSINGVPCHETGCPNSGARYDFETDAWVKQRVCFECGCTVDADSPCCSADVESDSLQSSDEYDAVCWNCQSKRVFYHSEVVGEGSAHYRCEDCGATGELTDFYPAPTGGKRNA